MTVKKSTSKSQSKANPFLSPLAVGNKVLIRTVTFHALGKIEAITDQEIIMSSASWLADEGVRHGDLLKTGQFSTASEIEVIPGPYAVGRGALVDACLWPFDLPTISR